MLATVTLLLLARRAARKVANKMVQKEVRGQTSLASDREKQDIGKRTATAHATKTFTSYSR